MLVSDAARGALIEWCRSGCERHRTCPRVSKSTRCENGGDCKTSPFAHTVTVITLTNSFMSTMGGELPTISSQTSREAELEEKARQKRNLEWKQCLSTIQQLREMLPKLEAFYDERAQEASDATIADETGNAELQAEALYWNRRLGIIKDMKRDATILDSTSKIWGLDGGDDDQD